jgi:hypothetical protein
LVFAAAYFFFGAFSIFGSATISFSQAIILSVSSFHGRGFLPQSISLGDAFALIDVVEAISGVCSLTQSGAAVVSGPLPGVQCLAQGRAAGCRTSASGTPGVVALLAAALIRK